MEMNRTIGLIALVFCLRALSAFGEDGDKNAGAAFKIPSPTVILSGKIGRVSQLPDPQKAPYEDCLFSAEFFPAEKQYMKTILLFPGFKGRVLLPEFRAIRPGISVRVHAVPFNDLPTEIQMIQQADELNDIDSEVFVVKAVEALNVVTASPRRIRREQVSIIPPETDAIAAEARSNRIRGELARINAIAARHGGFDNWRRECIFGKLKIGGTLQKEFNGVLFSWSDGACHFNAGYPSPNAVDGIAALNSFLLKSGIHLIVLIWPLPEEVAADLFFPDLVSKGEYLDVSRVQMMQELLSRNIEVVDLLPPLRAQRFRYPPLLFQAHMNDGHPASGATRIAGETVAAILRRYSLERKNDDVFAIVEVPMRRGRAYKDFPEVAVSLNGKNFPFADKSEILFAGDSYDYHPQSFSSVGAFCGFYSKCRVALHARSGGAQRLFRTLLQAQRQNGLLNRKKVIVLSVIPFTNSRSSWEIPVGYPDFKAATYEVRRTLSPENGFRGVVAETSVSAKNLDFSQGCVAKDTVPPREAIKLSLPDSQSANENILRLRIKGGSFYTLDFFEDKHPKANYTGGGTDREDEILIDFREGRGMYLVFPPHVTILEIQYMKQLK